MLSPELIQKIQRIHLKIGRRVDSVLAGEYRSRFRGTGMEFEEVRDYVSSDDVRLIDWNVTARMQKPFVKIFREERERSIMLVIDGTLSLNYSSCESTKIDVASELAAIIAYLAIRNNDRIGLVIFSDDVDLYIPPSKGRGHVWHIIRSVLTHEDQKNQEQGTADKAGFSKPKAKDPKAGLDATLEFLAATCKRRTTMFFVSDFLFGDFDRLMNWAETKHEAYWMRVNDRFEKELPGVGAVEMTDLETDAKKLFWFGGRNKTAELETWPKITRRAHSRGRPRHVSIAVQDDLVERVAQFFRSQ
jgi:uncharacterized protein (DUF58 family)